MATSYTSLLGLALPVTGELQGTWGDVVNNYITSYIDASVAGTQTISGSQTAVTLSVTNGTSLTTVGSGATGSAQFQIINCTGNPGGLLTITAPASSRQYIIINATSTNQSVKIVGSGPTTGVTLVAGEKAHVAWNGSDFVKIATQSGNGDFVTVDTTNLEVTNIKAKDGTAALSIADSTGVVSVSANPVLSGGTANGVAYLNGSKVLTTGSALTFNGSQLGIGVASPRVTLDVAGSTNVSGDSGLSYTFTGLTTRYLSGNNSAYLQSLDISSGTVLGGKELSLDASNVVFRTITGSSFAEQMRLTSTGLGIGTSSPAAPLSFGSTTGQKIRFYNTLSGYGIGVESSEFRFVTDNSAVFTWGIGTYASPSEQMRLTSTGLGIGTSSPATKLHVSLGGANALILENTGNTGVYARWKRPNREYYLALDINNNGGNDFSLYDATAAATRWTVDSSGNLGLGVTPSAWGATYKAAQIGTGGSVNGRTNTENQVALSANAFHNGTAWTYIGSTSATQYQQAAGTHYWFTSTDPTPTAGNTITFTQAMTLDASGNLGVGATTVNTKLELRTDTTTAGSEPNILLHNKGALNTTPYAVGGIFGAAWRDVRDPAYIAGINFYRNSASGGLNSSGEIIFYTANDGVSLAELKTFERARITSSGDFLIGSTSTSGLITGQLQLGTTSSSNAGIQFLNSTTGSGGLYFGDSTSGNARFRGYIEYSHNSDAMLFGTAESERARITSGGDFGVGTTSPGGKIACAVASSGTFQNAFVATNGVDSEFIARIKTNVTEIANGGSSGVIAFATGGSYTERARITSGGNFGIATTNPLNPFQLNTFGGLDGNANQFYITNNLYYDPTDARDESIKAGYSNRIVLDNISGGILFQTTSTSAAGANVALSLVERARITSGGVLLVNRQALQSGITDACRLQVLGTSGDWVSAFENSNSTTPYGLTVSYSGASPNGTGSEFLYCADSTAARAEIRSNGGLANYQSNNVDLSDIRTKTDISPLASYWSKIAALEIVSYKYKDQTHDDLNIGVIAQQVEQVAPEFVDADGFGETPEDGVPLKTIYNKDITFAAIKALQEAMARIEKLEAEVAALKGV